MTEITKQQAIKEAFDRRLEKQGVISAGQLKPVKKLDLKKYCCTFTSNLSVVYHYEGRAIASNGMVLAVCPELYDPSQQKKPSFAFSSVLRWRQDGKTFRINPHKFLSILKEVKSWAKANNVPYSETQETGLLCLRWDDNVHTFHRSQTLFLMVQAMALMDINEVQFFHRYDTLCDCVARKNDSWVVMTEANVTNAEWCLNNEEDVICIDLSNLNDESTESVSVESALSKDVVESFASRIPAFEDIASVQLALQEAKSFGATGFGLLVSVALKNINVEKPFDALKTLVQGYLADDPDVLQQCHINNMLAASLGSSAIYSRMKNLAYIELNDGEYTVQLCETYKKPIKTLGMAVEVARLVQKQNGEVNKLINK